MHSNNLSSNWRWLCQHCGRLFDTDEKQYKHTIVDVQQGGKARFAFSIAVCDRCKMYFLLKEAAANEEKV